MTSDAWIALTIFGLMFVLLIWNKFPSWIVFMGTLTLAMTFWLADTQNLISRFPKTGVWRY